MPEVLILTGPPGAGKSTVAEALAERYDRVALVSLDALHEFIRGADDDWPVALETTALFDFRSQDGVGQVPAVPGHQILYTLRYGNRKMQGIVTSATSCPVRPSALHGSSKTSRGCPGRGSCTRSAWRSASPSWCGTAGGAVSRRPGRLNGIHRKALYGVHT